MPLKNALDPEYSVEQGRLLDSRDLFSRELAEERLDWQLSQHIELFAKRKVVDVANLRTLISTYIKNIDLILTELEDAKRKAERAEYKKIESIQNLLSQSRAISYSRLREQLEKIAQSIQGNVIAALKSQYRRERRLTREQAPIGFIVTKLRKGWQVAKKIEQKTGIAATDSMQEHPLEAELQALIAELDRNPGPASLLLLSRRLSLLLERYRTDINDFLYIETNISIEEARNLHRIAHYITFLTILQANKVTDLDDLLAALKRLKLRTDTFIFQDAVNAKRLVQYATQLSYGISNLRSSNAKEFPGIRETRLTSQPGILVFPENNPIPQKGVVLMHGFQGNKETQLGLARLLALEGYIAYTIDMSAHGEDRQAFRYGRNAEYIQEAVEFLRKRGTKKVAVVAHSTGAGSAVFAMAGYSLKVEDAFYYHMTNLIQRLQEISSCLDAAQMTDDMLKDMRYKAALNSQEYAELKKLVLEGLNRVAHGSWIDAAVLMAPPSRLQTAMPRKLVDYLSNKDKAFFKKFASLVTCSVNVLLKIADWRSSHKYEYVAKEDEVQYIGLIIKDTIDFFEYLHNVQNPFDYLNFVEYIAGQMTNPSREKKSIEDRYALAMSNLQGRKEGLLRSLKSASQKEDHQLMQEFQNEIQRIDWLIPNTQRYFQQAIADASHSVDFFSHYWQRFIKDIPKAFFYGLNDEFLKPLQGKNMKELDEHYRKIGAILIRKYPNVNHVLVRESTLPALKFEGETLPRMVREIISFLGTYL